MLLNSIQAWTSSVISNKDPNSLIRTSHLKVGLFLVCLYPFFFMLWGFFTHQLGANPIDTVTRLSGLWALRF